MHKEIVSNCSPDNALSLYSVYRKEIPWRLILPTAYVPMRECKLFH